MAKLLEFFARNPWWVLTTLLALTLGAAFNLKHLEVRVSSEELQVKSDPQQALAQLARDRFGEDEIVLLYLSSDRLLEKSKLLVLREVVNQLGKLQYVERVDSLFSIPHVKSVDGFLNSDPYLKELPETKDEENRLLNQALGNSFLKKALISPDGKVMAVAIVLRDGYEADDKVIVEDLYLMTYSLVDLYDEVFTLGLPHVRSEIANSIKAEQGDLFPLAIAALLIALFILLRQVVDILIPVLTAGASIIWTLGMMALLGIPLTVVTSIVPILLIIVGSTEDIHLLSEFRQGQRNCLDTPEAIRVMSRKMGRTVLLTALTTYLAFLSVGMSKIEALWQFGLVSSTGLLLNFLITISLIPAVLSLTGSWQLDGRYSCYNLTSNVWSTAYWNFLLRYRIGIMITLTLVVAVMLAGVPLIKVNHDSSDSLGRDSEVRNQLDRINHDLAGLKSFSILVNSGIQDTFLKVRYIEELAKIQDYLVNQDVNAVTTSFADYLALANAAIQELDTPSLPYSDDEVGELMIFINYDHVKAFVTEDFSSARIKVTHNLSSTEALQQYVDGLERFIEGNLDPGLKAIITGESMLTLSATHAMIEGQLESILVLLVIIILIIAIIFTSLKTGLVAALPNIFPVIVLFGAMGYLEIPLNIGTTMAAAIAIGIAVDDTMHFMLRYNQELRTSSTPTGAMISTIHGESLPVLATSVALVAGFLVFSQSAFEPIAQFGFLSALVIASALIADFIITPLAITSLRLVTLWDLLSLDLRKQVIDKSDLFKGMRPWQIRKFILSSALYEYEKGEAIFSHHQESDAMYLVMTGSVRVCISRGEEGLEKVESFEPGELFGEIAMLANVSRKTEAFANEKTTLLVLSREVIEKSSYIYGPGLSRLFVNLAENVSRRYVKLISGQKGAKRNGTGEEE